MENNFKFVLIEASYLNNERYWVLFIEDFEDLFNYFEQSSPKYIKAYFELKNKKHRLGHCSTSYQSVIESIFLYNDDKNRKSIVDDVFLMSDTIQGTKIKYLLRGHTLLINSTRMGFCNFDAKNHKIIKRVNKIDFNFPTSTLTKKDIKITKWERGTHWYIRIGQHDLGEKFIDYKQAKKAGDKFLKIINKKEK